MCGGVILFSSGIFSRLKKRSKKTKEQPRVLSTNIMLTGQINKLRLRNEVSQAECFTDTKACATCVVSENELLVRVLSGRRSLYVTAAESHKNMRIRDADEHYLQQRALWSEMRLQRMNRKHSNKTSVQLFLHFFCTIYSR